MMKGILVGLAILAVSTSGALAAKKHAAKPEAAATPTPLMWQPGPTAADKAMYAKNMYDSGTKK